jgi:hypothetical protein
VKKLEDVAYLSERKLEGHKWCNVEGTQGVYVNSTTGTDVPNADFATRPRDNGSTSDKCVSVATSRILKRHQIFVPNYIYKH